MPAPRTSTGAGSGQLSKFGGIRVEDDLAVTRTGCENLTRDAFAAHPYVPARNGIGGPKAPD